MQSKSLIALTALLAQAYGSPVDVTERSIQARAVINHDAVEPFPETVQSGAIGDLIKKFEPFLHIAHGCQSYPAVNANGDTRYVN